MEIFCQRCGIVESNRYDTARTMSKLRDKLLKEGWHFNIVYTDEYWLCPNCHRHYEEIAEKINERAERLKNDPGNRRR